MKYAILFIFFTFFLITAASEKEKGYKTPVLVKAVGAKAVLENGSVKISWKKYTRGDLLFYKVVKSKTNKNPVYPEDGYIFYTTDENITSFYDKEIEEGVWYYRVCVITKGKERWVSEVIQVNVKKESAESKVPTEKDFE